MLKVDSFETPLRFNGLLRDPDVPFPGVFIRAPVVDSLLLPSDLAKVGPEEPTQVKRPLASDLPDEVPKPISAAESVPVSSTTNTALAEPPLPNPATYTGAGLSDPLPATALRIVTAPSLYESGRPRPPLQILAALDAPVVTPKSPSNEPVQSFTSTRSGASEQERQQRGIVSGRPDHDSQIVALRQGRVMVTSFHPELTSDTRLHEYFVKEVVMGPDPQ